MKAQGIRTIAIVGAGIMGHGIAQKFAMASYAVHVTDVNGSALQTTLARIERNLTQFVDAGLVSAADVPSILARIDIASSLEEAVSNADVVFEAAAEDPGVKRVLFNQLDACCPDRTILASNSSSLLISEFASETNRQDRCILTHWINPPHIVPAVEVIPGRFTSTQTIDTVCELLRTVGKVPVRVQKEIAGYLVNRIQMAMFREVWALWGEGVASAEDLDTAVKCSFGFRLPTVGPLLANDLAGTDTTYTIARRLLPDLDASPEPSPAFGAMIQAGDYGLKTGRGFYERTPEEWQATIEARDRELLARLKCLCPPSSG